MIICSFVNLPAPALSACAVLSQSASKYAVVQSPVSIAVSATIAQLLVSVIAPLATTTAQVLQAVILVSNEVVSHAIISTAVSKAVNIVSSVAIVTGVAPVIIAVHLAGMFAVEVLIADIFTSSVAITTLWLPALLFPEFTSVAVPAILATFTFSVTVAPPPVTVVCTLYAAVSDVPVVAFLPKIIPDLWSRHSSPAAKFCVISLAISISFLFSLLSIAHLGQGCILAIGNTVPVVQVNDVASSFPIIAPISSRIPV